MFPSNFPSNGHSFNEEIRLGFLNLKHNENKKQNKKNSRCGRNIK